LSSADFNRIMNDNNSVFLHGISHNSVTPFFDL
jgi:hypothetical protein